jgi:EAL and modified HD-GYP domain-containing signal transduction protein
MAADDVEGEHYRAVMFGREKSLATVNSIRGIARPPIAGAMVGESCVRYVARQPILNLEGRAKGYELLFREGCMPGFTGDGEQATRTMLDNLLLFDLQRLTGGEAAFINCTAETLTSGLAEMSSSETTVLELLETIRPTPELVRSCSSLKAKGYRLALDDFEWQRGVEPLVEMADFIKVDFVQSDASKRRKIMDRLRGYGARLIAEKVETQSDFEQAKREGFELFQGYFFCRPELLTSRVLPSNVVVHMQLMQALQCEEMDFKEMAGLLKRDPAITYRLLRMVNAAGFGMRREICSVEMALISVGERRFRNLAMVAIAAGLCPSHAWEVLRMALVRARFCELSATGAGYNPTEQYLVGLLSLLPAMMQTRMEDALANICLREEIRCTLLGECNEESWLLRWMESQERGEWKECDRIAAERSLSETTLLRNLGDAVHWADGMLCPVQ